VQKKLAAQGAPLVFLIYFLHMVTKLRDTLTKNIGVQFEAWPLFIAGICVLFVAFIFMERKLATALSLALFLAPVWMPFLVVGGAWDLWYIFQRSVFLDKQKYILLEIKLPRTIVKTPLAMETFLSNIHLTGGESTWYARFRGGTRPFWSLEIASFEGQVHFYIWGRESFRRIVESTLYAQYPGVQIVEALDYSRTISAQPEDWVIWGCDYKSTAEEPIPIKTYIEYGLDKVQKEPEQVDPLGNVIEFMGAMGKGEYLWLQLVTRAHKGEKYNKLNKSGKPYTWKDEAKEVIEKIRTQTRDVYTDPATGESRPGFPNPTKGQSETIAAIERNVSKLAFDVGARAIYLAKPSSFQSGSITQVIGLFKPFTSEGWNGFRPNAWMTNFDDYPWEVGTSKRKDHYRREMVEAYRRRQFFYAPFYHGGSHLHDAMVMSTEELATIYHLPSGVVQTPGLARVPSATAEAPPNLPV
jgi:hypothetical protein